MFFVRHCRFHFAVVAVTAAMLASTPCAADEISARLEISFAAKSTLHDFEGSAPQITLIMTPESGDAGLWSADAEVPVATLDTGSDSRDENMREMFDAAHFPTIRAVLGNVDPDAVRESRTLPFVLVIRDVEHETIAAVSNWRGDDEEVSFDVSFEISLEKFGLEAPGILFIRVADRVTVTVHATVSRT
jgi:polyisoprenoid-binding protein YceI